MKYTLSEIAHICGGNLVGKDTVVSSVVTDSRSYAVKQGALFVAMRGVNHDAHDYIGDMCERGVRAFIVEREVDIPAHCGCVVVENSLVALQRLAANYRSGYTGRVVAITGSNGKTVVKEWIAQCAPEGVKLFRSPRSYNSQLGVALSLLMIDYDTSVAIIEAGISYPGEMSRLEAMIRPDIVLYTSIGDAHQENFTSLDEKIDEKLNLAAHATTIIYNSEYANLEAAVKTRFSDRILVDAACECVPSMKEKASTENCRSIAALFRVLGYEKPDFSLLQSVAMRLEVKQGIEDSIIIDDSYSADINSLSIALDLLRSTAANRNTMLILSDILQSGMGDKELAVRVAAMVEESGVGEFVAIGKKFEQYRSMFKCPSRFYGSTEEFLSHLSEVDVRNKAILVKGSRRSAFERISHRLELKSHTTVLEVNLRAMAANVNYFRRQIPSSTRLVAMVKASSYGAGDGEVARALQKQGVSYLAVAFADEGVALRDSGVTMPIVVLNADEGSFDVMIASSLEPEIYSFRSLRAFERELRVAGETSYPIHLKFDTGMHRLGFSESEVEELLREIDEYGPTLRVASVFTHLATADDPTNDEYTLAQLSLFDRISKKVISHFDYPILRHAEASAAMLRFPEYHFDMCRLGIGLYGFGWGSENLEIISTLRTRVVQIHTLDAGQTVGYGRAGMLTRQSRIATIPIGYADGLDRHLGCGRWSMLVAGCPAPTVGRICMDSCMIDITDIEGVEEGDEVTIFSSEKGNTAEDMAAVLDTISYEVLTSVSKRVKRIYIDE